MGTIKKFEDIEAWKRARELSNAIYKLTSDGSFSKDFVLRDQMQRSVISISSNIAEGFERGGDGEFGQFLAIAKGSCGELRSQLYLAFDQKYFNKSKFDELVENALIISRLISSLMKYLRNSSVGGVRFKQNKADSSKLQRT